MHSRWITAWVKNNNNHKICFKVENTIPKNEADEYINIAYQCSEDSCCLSCKTSIFSIWSYNFCAPVEKNQIGTLSEFLFLMGTHWRGGGSQSALSVPAIGSEICTSHLASQRLVGRPIYLELNQWEPRRLDCKALVWVPGFHSPSLQWLWTWEAKCWKPSAAACKAVGEDSWQLKQYKIKGRKGRERRQDGERDWGVTNRLVLSCRQPDSSFGLLTVETTQSPFLYKRNGLVSISYNQNPEQKQQGVAFLSTP